MTIHEPLFTISCDTEGCPIEETIPGAAPIADRYECRDSDVVAQLPGWLVLNGKHYCDDCCEKMA